MLRLQLADLLARGRGLSVLRRHRDGVGATRLGYMRDGATRPLHQHHCAVPERRRVVAVPTWISSP